MIQKPVALNNEEGFAMALIMALLPLMLGLVLVTLSVIAFIQTDQKYKYVCRSEGLSAQKLVGSQLERLLEMNKKALEIQKNISQARIQAASGNPKALALLAKLEAEALVFHIRQLQLIENGNRILRNAHRSTLAKMKNLEKETQSQLPLMAQEIKFNSPLPPSLAVRPDSMAMPPTYSPLVNFSVMQALAHKWLYRVKINTVLQPFLTGDYKFEKKCTVTLRREGSKWIPQITNI